VHHIELLTTGGTIEKTYDEASQELANTSSIVPRMLRRLKLPQTKIHVRELMHKDSLSLTDADRERIVQTATMGIQLTKSIVVLQCPGRDGSRCRPGSGGRAARSP
jgi:L-asparaginase